MTSARALHRMRGGSGVVAFDDGAGRVLDQVVPDAVVSGAYCEIAGTAVAIYAADGALVLHIGGERFGLAEPAVRVHYSHHAGNRETTFRVEDGDRAVELRYEAWWSELGLTPPHVRIQPEEDEHEDYLAFISILAAHPAQQARLVAQWGGSRAVP